MRPMTVPAKLKKKVSAYQIFRIQAHNQEFFRIDEVSWNEGASIYTLLSAKHQAKASKRNIFECFFLYILKTAFQMRKVTHILTIISVFFSKIRALFTIFNHIRAEVRPLSREPLRTHFVDHGNTTIHYLGFFQVLHDKLNTSTNFTYLNFLESPRPKLVEYLQLPISKSILICISYCNLARYFPVNILLNIFSL